jgi:hypothetical protein
VSVETDALGLAELKFLPLPGVEGKLGPRTPSGSFRIQRKVLKDWSRPY